MREGLPGDYQGSLPRPDRFSRSPPSIECVQVEPWAALSGQMGFLDHCIAGKFQMVQGRDALTVWVTTSW